MNSQLAPLSPGNLTERHYEMLVQAVVDYAIFMLDPEGYVVSWNAGAARTKGYAAVSYTHLTLPTTPYV